MKNSSIILALILLLTAQFVFQKEVLAVIADPTPFNYKQPDGTTVTIKFKGDEFVSWGETLDGYTLLSDGKNGWAYAVLNADGDLVCSGILAHNQGERTAIETSLLPQMPKKLRFSQKQIDHLRSSSGVQLKSATATTAFTPNGSKKLLLILIDFTDQQFNSPSTAHTDFDGLLNTVGYTGHNAHGSVHDFFYESSYGNFNLTTDVVGPFHAAHNMAYYGENVGNEHSPNAKELITEAVLAADPYVNYADYANSDGTVEGVYVVYAGYGEATSHITANIWPHAGNITARTLDGVSVSRYSCSNELTAGGTELTTIGVICHEFGHVCGSPDFYDTDYEAHGQFEGDGNWDVMDGGVYNGNPSGSQPPHFNPYIKDLFGWCNQTTGHPYPRLNELNTTGTYTIPDITSTAATTPQIYKINTKTSGEYFLIENRQQTGFNSAIPGHGLMIYHKGAVNYTTNKNTKHPQGFYPVCASSTTAIPVDDPASYGDISSDGCPFPGRSGKRGFYDAGTPSARSWAGENTEMPITNITENGDGTVSFTIPSVTACTPTFANQATAFLATPALSSATMDIKWERGDGNNVLVVAHEGSAVDFAPLNGKSYSANAAFKAGDEIGAGNYVVYNGTGTTASLTGLSGGTAYYFAVYEYNLGSNCYLTPALTGNGTTNCVIDPSTFTENFDRNTFGSCWTATDNTGQGNWQIGAKSNVNYTPALTGNYAYFSCEYGDAHNYNADLISPTFDLTSYANVVLKFNHLFDRSSSYSSTGTVSYSIDNGATWSSAIATYSSADSPNPELVTLNINGAAGKSQVKFKWNYTCSPTGAYMWAVDDIQVTDNSNYWTGTTSTDWFTSTNWSTGAIPTATSSAVIPSEPTNQPQINAANAVCLNLAIQSGASLTMNASTAYTLSVGGDWTNNGTFTRGIGTVDFNGTNDLQLIKGSSTSAFNILKVTKGVQNRILEATSEITLNTTTNPLVLTSGTFKLSSASTIVPFTDATGAAILSAAGLWNNGGTINSGNFNWTLNGGLLKISAGTTNIGTTSNINLIYLNSGKFYLEGGVLNISGRFLGNSTASSGSFSITGGTVTVNKVGSTVTDRAPFEINTVVPFTMSGGSIIVQKASSNSTADVIILSTTSNVTGGTLQIGNTSTTGSPIVRINSTAPIYSLAVNATGTPTAQIVTNPLTIKGDITIGSGTTMNANNLNLSVGGNWTNNGTFAPGTALVTFNGTAAQSLSGTTATSFNNFTLNNNNGLSLSGSVNATVNGTLTFTSGVISTGNNKLIIPSTGSIARTSGHVFGNLQKNFATGTSVSRTFEIGDATEANYAPVTVSFAEVTTAGNLVAKTVSGDHTSVASSTLNAAKSVNRYWTLTNSGVGFTTYDGTFSFATSDLDVSASTTNLIGGKYTSSAWTYPTVGTKTSTSTQITGITSFGDFQLAENFGKTSTGGNWSADATWSPSGVPVATDNVLILSPGTVVVDVTNAVCQELTIQSGAKLQIDPLQALTVSETITNNSDATGLVIKSDLSGTGSLIATNVSGRATAESYLTGNRWYNVSPIVSGGTVNSFIQNSANGIPSKDVGGIMNYGMMSYNETGNLWNSYYTATTTDNLNAAQGYSLRRSADGVVTYVGTVSSGTKTISLTNAGEGWNCIGNPYTSAIKLNDAAEAANNFLTTNASSLDASYACIYVWDESYKGYKILGNSPAVTTERALGQNIFQSGQGFFVKAKADAAQITFNQAMQLHQTDRQLKSGNVSWPDFELTASLDKTKASTVVAFNTRMTKGLDPTYDAGLLRGSSGLELYTRLVEDNDVDFAIQCLPDNNFDKLVIPVGIDSKAGGTVVFSADVKNLPSGCSVILEDKLNMKFTDLALSDYQTVLEAGSTDHSRFQIHTSYLTTGISDSDLTGGRNLVAFSVGNTEIRIQGRVNDGAIATLYDNIGRTILTSNLVQGDLNIIHSQVLKTGVYMLSVKDTGAVKVFKLLIKE